MHSASRVLMQMERHKMAFKVPQMKPPQINVSDEPRSVLMDVPVQASCSTLRAGGYRNKVKLAPGHSALDWQEMVSTKGKAGKLITGIDSIREDPKVLEHFKEVNSPQSLIQLERGVPTYAIRPPLCIDAHELARHNTAEDCWTVINGKVYSISSYLSFHPGGAKILIDKSSGQDSTVLFNRYHRWISVEKMLETCLVGVYVG